MTKDQRKELDALIDRARDKNTQWVRDDLLANLRLAVAEIDALQRKPVNAAGESRGAILREVLETIFFGLREPAPDIATLRRLAAETLDDDAAIRGRFEGTGVSPDANHS